jgi:cell pole-organizing protein PopZ
MSDTKASEPSIEDILASIRKIISDDDTEEAAPAEALSPVADAIPVPDPLPLPTVAETEPQDDDDDDDILDLTEVIPEPEPSASEEPPAVVAAPLPEPSMEQWPENNDDDEALASPETVHAAADAFSRLVQPEPKPHVTSEMPVDASGKSVEDLVRELLRPLLREWIDGNLPDMVECLVQKELRKISRRPEDF